MTVIAPYNAVLGWWLASEHTDVYNIARERYTTAVKKYVQTEVYAVKQCLPQKVSPQTS
jgi:hypothetical protein